MALTNVCAQTQGGLRRITIGEIQRMNPEERKEARKWSFICAKCRKKVIVAIGDNVSPYFKHSREDDEKNCKDRSPVSAGGGGKAREGQGHLKLCLKDQLTVCLSLNMPSRELIEKNPQSYLRVHPSGRKELCFPLASFQPGEMMDLPVGEPVERYDLSVGNASLELQSFFPERISGADGSGTLFDASTRRRLSANAAVFPEQSLLLLLLRSEKASGGSSVSIEELETGSQRFKLLQIQARTVNASSTRFFLNYNVRLIQGSRDALPLWPPCAITPSGISLPPRNFYLYIQGEESGALWVGERTEERDGRLAVVPQNTKIFSIPVGNGMRHLRWMPASSDSSERSELWKSGQGEAFGITASEETPDGKSVKVTSRYDAEARFFRGSILLDRLKLPAGESRTLTGLGGGVSAQLYLGRDLVRSFSPGREDIGEEEESKPHEMGEEPEGPEDPEGAEEIEEIEALEILDRRMAEQEEEKLSDSETAPAVDLEALYDAGLLLMLKQKGGPKVRIDHLAGTVMRDLRKVPRTQRWFASEVRRGRISKAALDLIQQYREAQIEA